MMADAWQADAPERWAIHFYETPAVPTDSFETLAISGPFDTADEARAALEGAGWFSYEADFWHAGRGFRGPVAELMRMGAFPAT
jgi:hypothetical protein